MTDPDNKIISRWLQQKFSFHKASGTKILLVNQPAAAYPGSGAFTLVDVVQNDKGLARSSEFLSFNGTDLDATIDMATFTNIHIITIHVLDQQDSWIYVSSQLVVTYLAVADPASTIAINAPIEIKSIVALEEKGTRAVVIESKQNCRYLHIVVQNFGIIPEGNPGASNPARLFVDEIVVDELFPMVFLFPLALLYISQGIFYC